MSNYIYKDGFYTRKFGEIFYPADDDTKTSYDVFREMFQNSGIPLKIKESSLETLFYLLYAKYGDSNIAGVDENQFKYALQSRIFMYGPAWEKRLEVQDKLVALSLDDGELFKGGEAIYNSAAAPGSQKANLLNEDGKLQFLNGQNTTEYRKSKIEGYAVLLSLLETDVTLEFINKFSDLFMPIPLESYMPVYLTYQNKEE